MTTPLSRGPGHDVLLESPDVTLARWSLGLTLYLDEPFVWASEGAAALLARYLEVAPVDRLAWYTTSMLPDWHRFTPRTTEGLLRSLSVPWSEVRVRHLFTFRLVDDLGAPEVGFFYKEIDEARGRRGFLQLLLPPSHDPGDLLQLAQEISERWPVLSGVGGYMATWNEWLKSTAFWSLFRWSKRFLGLDIQDPDPMSWHVAEGLPGSNWLTLVGDKLAQKLELDVPALRQRTWTQPIRVHALRRATLVQAGSAPTLGDLNALRYPAAYAEAARALEPCFVKEPPEYWGGFFEEKRTRLWLRRLVDPEALR
ncbi:type VI immunity family protein [Hyalangium versicolor]|uniref:type VI immunity family protein n=1 Tax=Hyalangium versicolor TaxID=2861190 RepID=UPI001CCF4DFA|nr:type VI immunity family protein [Hyalangium versicolor]